MDGSRPAATGGGGDSFSPAVSPDGRYVLFASNAGNLVTNTSSSKATQTPKVNVFLRDRMNGITTLVSVNVTGAGGGNGDSIPCQISTNGRYALFESRASDLVLGDTNGVADVFLRDVTSGTTILVSMALNGAAANGASRSSTMTPDGRYVAFVSGAANLVTGDTNEISDVFLRDMQIGATALVSAGARSAGLSVPMPSSEAPEITPDGQYVAFLSTASNLVPGITNAGHIYLRDLLSQTTQWISADARALLGMSNVTCFNHALSVDGAWVIYEATSLPRTNTSSQGMILRFNRTSGATEIIHANATVPNSAYEDIRSLTMTPDGRFVAFVANAEGTTAGTNTCVNVWDGQNGVLALVSRDLNGNLPTGTCDWPQIDSTGRYIAFVSSATNLVTNSLSGDSHIYIRDMQAGQTSLVAVDAGGIGSETSPATIPVLSENGLVVFEAADANLVTNNLNPRYDVFMRNVATGTVDLISAHAPGLPSSTASGASFVSANSLSSDGRFIAFSSEGDNLISNDTNHCRDIFVRDRVQHTNLLVSVDTSGMAGDFTSSEPAMSSDGRFVAFTSLSDNLVSGDTNRVQDVFLRDLQSGTTSLVSANTNGTASGNGPSYSPLLSSDARFVLFRSRAGNLARGSSSSGISENLILRDITSGTSMLICPSSAPFAAITPDASLIACASNSLLTSTIYLWDVQSARAIYTNTLPSGSSLSTIGLSPDGRWLLYVTNNQITSVDIATRTHVPLSSASFYTRNGFGFSADSRWLTFAARPVVSGPTQIFVCDLSSAAVLQVTTGTVTCDSPAISGDGRFIAYRSFGAPDSATGDVPQIWLYDRSRGESSLVSSAVLTDLPGNGRSFAPVFSRDRNTLLFASWAEDLTPFDFNGNADLFALPLLYLSIAPSVNTGYTLSWLADPALNYRVESKTNLAASAWQPVAGTIDMSGGRAYFTDAAPLSPSGQRFYRVVAF